MTILRRFINYCRNLIDRDRVEQELNDELKAYLELAIEEKIQSGLSPQEARRAALIEMGGIDQVKENVRATRLGHHWESFVQDLRYGLRILIKQPGFSLIVVIMLALGIGANTAIFSVINAVLLRPLAYHQPQEIMTILNDGQKPVSPGNFLDLQSQSKSFDQLSVAEAWSGTLTNTEPPEVVRGLRMGLEMFPLLNVPPLLGRSLQKDDFHTGKDHVVVLSYKLWQRAYGGDKNIIGREMVLTGERYTIVGVMPQQFQFPSFWSTRTELWLPLDLTERATNRRFNSLRVFGRLKPGINQTQAQAEIDLINHQLAVNYPEANTNLNLRVDPLNEKVVGNVRPSLMVLAATVLFVLLIACANVACLLLVRWQSRQSEIALRAALGASRARIIRQLLTESLLLVSLGAIGGLIVAVLGVHWLTTMLSGETSSFALKFTRVNEIKIDSITLLFTIITTLITGLIFGLAPALSASKTYLQSALKERGRGISSGGRRLREALVIGELALALVLLIGAGLLMNSFLKLQAVDAGFTTDKVITATVSLAGANQYVGPTRENYYQNVLAQLRSLPEVETASAINHLPLEGDVWGTNIIIDGQTLPANGQEINVVFRVSRPDYFRVMGIPLRSGRDFTDQDRPDTPGVVIINETLAQQQWPGVNPIGRRLTLDDPRDTSQPTHWLTIVGVVKDVKQDNWMAAPSNEIYLPFQQSQSFYQSKSLHMTAMTLVIRTSVAPENIISAISGRIRSVDRFVPVSRIMTMDQIVTNTLWQPRFNLQILALFAGLALLLAALGLYGVISYAVMQRTAEVGVRLALGAQQRDIIGLFVGQGLKLTLLGLTAGLLIAVWLTRLMTRLLFEVQATDPITFVGVTILLMVVALLACWIPARRAAKVDPIIALRHE